MTPHWVVYRDVVTHGGKPVRKFLRRPQGSGARWSWATNKTGCAWFHDAVQAEAYAKSYEGAEVLFIGEKKSAP